MLSYMLLGYEDLWIWLCMKFINLYVVLNIVHSFLMWNIPGYQSILKCCTLCINQRDTYLVRIRKDLNTSVCTSYKDLYVTCIQYFWFLCCCTFEYKFRSSWHCCNYGKYYWFNSLIYTHILYCTSHKVFLLYFTLLWYP